MAAAGALAISSCGSGADSPNKSATRDVANASSAEERRAARVIEHFEDAANKEDARRACQELLARESTGKRCVQDLALLFSQPAYRTLEITVREVAVRGRTATARVVLRIGRATRGERETYSLVKEDGEWRLALRVGGKPSR